MMLVRVRVSVCGYSKQEFARNAMAAVHINTSSVRVYTICTNCFEKNLRVTVNAPLVRASLVRITRTGTSTGTRKLSL